MTTRKPKKPTKPKRLARKSSKPSQKSLKLRDKFGRFVAAKKPTKLKPKPKKPTGPRRGANGQFLPKFGPKPKPKKSGPLRDSRGRFLPRKAYVTIESGHADDRVNDGPRRRVRTLTYQEAIDLYEFDEGDAMLPEWLEYLAVG